MKQTEKVILTLTESQARVIASALDFYSRIMMGQFCEIESLFIHETKNQFWRDDENRAKLKELLSAARQVVYPELDPGSYYGILGDKVPERAQIAYDVQCTLENIIAWHNHPEGGNQRIYDSPFHAVKSQPLPGCIIKDEPELCSRRFKVGDIVLFMRHPEIATLSQYTKYYGQYAEVKFVREEAKATLEQYRGYNIQFADGTEIEACTGEISLVTEDEL